jgi:outer membrane protein TolC
MRVKFFAVIAMFSTMASFAQQGPQVFTLRQCIDYAIQKNTMVVNATLDEYIAKYKTQEYIGTGLPQANAAFNVQHSDPLRRMFIYGSPTTTSTFGVPAGEVVAIPNLFQLKNSADVSLTVSQLLFSNSFFTGLKAVKSYQQLAVQNKEFNKVQVIESVCKAYYMAVISIERISLFDINIGRVDSLLKQTISMNKAGFAEKIDVDRLEVTLNNLVTEKARFENMLQLSGVLLKYQMNMPIDQELAIADKIQDIKLDSAIIPGGGDFSNRPEYKQLQAQLRFDELNYKATKQSYLPTASLGANMGVFNQSAQFDYLSQGHAFYPYATYSLSVNMPIFSGLSRLKRVQQSQLSFQKTQNNVERFKSTAATQTASAEIQYKNSLQSLNAQKRNMDLAKEVARVTTIKFTSGIGPNIEVVTAEAALREAQINYYNAFYDALVARVEYDKALGNLK